jgi:uncharacterized integral membrane protein
MRKSIYLILTITLLILVVVLTLQNTGEVSIRLLFWHLYIPLAILIFAMFALGVIVTILTLTPSLIATKVARIRSQRKSVSHSD